MTSPVDIHPDHLAEIHDILHEHLTPDVDVWVFGSRADWTATDSSDLDLALEGDSVLDSSMAMALGAAFEDSSLPYAVDVIDLNRVGRGFRQIVEKQKRVLPDAGGMTGPTGGWLTLPFGDCAELVRDRVSPIGLGDSPYVGLEHMGEGTLSLVGCGSADGVYGVKKRFRRGDILFGILRPRLRKIARVDFDGICSTNIWVVRPTGMVDADFLFYLMASQKFIDVAARGSEEPATSRARWGWASRYETALPPLAEQRATAHALGVLDGKIELTRRMNQTLGETVRGIFESWFVDFEPVRAKMDGRWNPDENLPGMPSCMHDVFPDRLAGSALGDIPEGWKSGTLNDTIELLGGGTPRTAASDYWGGGVLWYAPRDAPPPGDIFVIGTKRTITLAGAESIHANILPAKTTVISASGTVGRLACLGLPMAISRACYGVRGVNGYPDFFTYWNVRNTVNALQARTHGTTFNTITRETFKFVETVLVPPDLAKMFDSVVRPAMNRILANLHESQHLMAWRDALLPVLMRQNP